MADSHNSPSNGVARSKKDVLERFTEALQSLPHPPRRDYKYYWRESRETLQKNSNILLYAALGVTVLAAISFFSTKLSRKDKLS